MSDAPVERGEDEPPALREGFVGFEVVGKTPQDWRELRPMLIATFQRIILDLNARDSRSGWLREQAEDLGNLAIDHVKARLRREGAEVERTEAEVARTYAERERTLAEARKTNAEAEAVELETTVKKLRLMLKATRAMMIGDTGNEAALFGQQIEGMLDALKSLAEPEGV